ncbi:hypothetical protein FRB93_002357 [Tulasnella sp. JGI-2019a]|nr:hypothetical protein FRB93_002357 [Tulasnella sp. JGI-2019a]
MRFQLLAFAASLAGIVLGQNNVTIQDVNPRVVFDPLCSPRTTQCTGGWWSFAFSATSQRTITYGPAGGAAPNATFTFNGTAVYYYGISSALTASVKISLDDGTPALVNLTSTYNLNYSSPINYPVFAWSAVNLDPTIQHTFFLTFDEPDGLGKWAGFDSIVYTEPDSTSSSSALAYSASQTQVAVSTPAGTSAVSSNSASSGSTNDPNQTPKHSSHGAAIGGAIGGVIVLLIIIGCLVFYCLKRRKNNGGAGGNGWSIDDTGRRNGVGEMGEAGAAVGRRGGATTTYAPSASLGGPASNSDVRTPFLAAGSVSPSMTSSTLPGTTVYESLSSAGGGTTPHNTMPIPLPNINAADLQRPESIALILQQQREIMSLLQRQQGSTGTGGSQATSAPTPTNNFPIAPQSSKQLYEMNRPPGSTRPVLPLPPGAAPPGEGAAGSPSPGPLSPQAEDSAPAPPAYTPK